MAHTDYTARGLALPFCPTARLALPIGALDTTATMDGYTSPIGDGIRVGMAAMIEGEIVVVEARSGNTLTLGRGTCDTIPAPHPANAVIFFFDDSLGSDDRQYVATESIGVKPLPRTNSSGSLAIESAPAEGLTFNWRFNRPYPPGDVTINGQPFTTTGALGPATSPLTLAWAHRDRIVQMDQLIKHGAPSIGPEPGTTYRILVIRTSDGSVRRSVDLGAVVAWTYTFAQMVADFGPSLVDIPAYITLESRRDGLSSWQSYRINFVAQASIATGSRTLDLGYEILLPAESTAVLTRRAPGGLAYGEVSNAGRTYTFSNTFSSWGSAWVRTASAGSGKRYFEVVNVGPQVTNFNAGFIRRDRWSTPVPGGFYPLNPLGEPSYLASYGTLGGAVTGRITNGSRAGDGNYTWNAGDVCQIAVDFDTGKIWYGKNGTWLGGGNPAAGTGNAQTLPSADFDVYVSFYTLGTGTRVLTCNFDEADMAYPMPSGFTVLP